MFWGRPLKVKAKAEKAKFFFFCNTEWFEIRDAFRHSLITCVSFPLLQVMAVQALVTSRMA